MRIGLYAKQVHELFEGEFWFIPQPTIAHHGGICFVVANSVASVKSEITTIVEDRMYPIEVRTYVQQFAYPHVGVWGVRLQYA